MEEAAVRLLLEFAAGGGVPVVCSQGGVIRSRLRASLERRSEGISTS